MSAALANAVLLFGVAVWVLIEAVARFADPPAVPGVPLMITAAPGWPPTWPCSR